MNSSDWTDGLIDPVASFFVRIPSQNDYKSIKISSKHQKTPSEKVQKRQIFRKQNFIGKLFRQKSTWYGSSGRSAKWKILVHWSSFFHLFEKTKKKLDFHDQHIAFYLNMLISTPVFQWKSTFSFGALFDLFLEEHTASRGGFDIILK